MRRIRNACIISVVFCSGMLYGQNYNSIIRGELDAMFSSLEKNRVPTGLLRDYAVEEVDLDLYNGYNIHDTCAVILGTFSSILNTIRSSNVRNTSPCCPPDTLLSDMYDYYAESSIIPVGIAAFKYNYIVANALSDSLLVYDENANRVYDYYRNGGIWANPYDEAKVVGFSPLVNTSHSRSFSYYFNEDFIKTNLPISYIEFDPGDGSGFHQVAYNSSVSASYDYFTTYYPQLRIHTEGGTTLMGKSVVYIVENTQHTNPNNAPSSIVEPDDSLHITGHDYLNGKEADAVVSIRYGDGRQGSSTLLRPFIIAEGIDPISYNSEYSDNTYYSFLGYNNIETAIDDMDSTFANHYDVVYIDWLDSNASIQTSADIVRQVIEWVNDNKADPSIPNIIMGESMGGLAVRYALCKMEQAGTCHQVSTFISHDSPHLGANVPLGLFYAARTVWSLFLSDPGSYLNAVLEEVENATHLYGDFNHLLSAFSTRQMLCYYVEDGYTINNQLHSAWQQELNLIGFPHGDGITDFSMIASSNGGFHQSYLTYVPFFDISGTLDITAIIATMRNVIAGNNSAVIGSLLLPRSEHYSIRIAALPFCVPYSLVYFCRIDYHKKFLWFSGKTVSLESIAKVSPASGYPLDKAKSSYYSANKILRKFESIHYDNTLLGHVNIDLSIGRDSLAGFIPTVSSLCIGKGLREPTDTEYQEDFSGSTNYFFDRTPFNSYFVNSNSSKHISYMPGMFSWIQEMDTLRILGPSTVVSGDSFSMTNPNLHPSWTSSDTSVATVSSYTGQVTVNSQGEFTLSCTGTGANYRPYHFEKAVQTAVFDYTLSSSCPPGSMAYKPFTVRANSVTWDQTSGIPPAVFTTNTSGHRFFFSIHPLVSNSPITWVEELTPAVFLSVPEGGPTVVSFKAELDGRYSDVLTICCYNLCEFPEFPIGGGGEIGPGGDDPIGPDPNPDPDPDPDPGELPDPDPDGVNSPHSSACTFYIEGEELSYPSMPSSQELLEDIKKISSFWEKIGTVKPRGEKDFLILPYQYLDKESGKKYDSTLKFIYRGK